MERVEGWENIAAFFPYNTEVVRKKFGPEMLDLGFVCKSYVGKGKHVMYWSFPKLIKLYICMKQAKEGRV
jgi:hypothetical protein